MGLSKIKQIFTKNKEVEMAFVKANKELLKSTLNFDKGLCRIDKYERQACAFREMVERCEKEKGRYEK